MAHDHGPGLATACRWMAAAALVWLAMPVFGQSSDPAVKAQQELQKCQDAFIQCATASCKVPGPACLECEKIRDRCRADVNSNLRGKDPSKPPEKDGQPPKIPAVWAWVCAVPYFPAGVACTPDANPCTFDSCLDGKCSHQFPTMDMKLTSPDDFYISGEPRMPAIVGSAKIQNVEPDPTATTQLKWSFSIAYKAPNGRVVKSDLTFNGAADTQPVFSKIAGGTLTARVVLVRDGVECGSMEVTQQIKGRNPPFEEIKKAVGNDPLLSKLICHESGGKLQFDKNGEPVSDGKGFGAMQVTTPPPSDEAFWNWKKNIEEGLAIYKGKIKTADNYYARMRKQGAPPLTAEQQKQNQLTAYNGGYYWYFRGGKWVADPHLQPWPKCKGQKQSAKCKPYYDLVMERKCS